MTTSYPTVTSTRLAPVMLAGSHFDVDRLDFSEYVDAMTGATRPASTGIHLTGVRGATYFLRGFLGDDTGVRQVISWKSGQPLRIKGNEVRVIVLGDVIEVL